MFFDIFNKLCQKKGISCKKAATDIGLANSITTKWKDRGSTPNAKTLNKIADYFGVSVGYLLGEEDNEKPILSAAKQAFIDEAMELTDEQVKALTETVRTFKATWKK